MHGSTGSDAREAREATTAGADMMETRRGEEAEGAPVLTVVVPLRPVMVLWLWSGKEAERGKRRRQ